MKNESGIRPCEYNVLVKQDETQEKTKGGLYLTSEVQDREKHAQTRGVIVAVSPMAFNEDVWPGGMDRPGPGTRVAFARAAGTFIEGTDGEEYRVVKDKDIVAVIEG
jgi:co-chaperonin GroES (HSP10)